MNLQSHVMQKQDVGLSILPFIFTKQDFWNWELKEKKIVIFIPVKILEWTYISNWTIQYDYTR